MEGGISGHADRFIQQTPQRVADGRQGRPGGAARVYAMGGVVTAGQSAFSLGRGDARGGAGDVVCAGLCELYVTV